MAMMIRRWNDQEHVWQSQSVEERVSLGSCAALLVLPAGRCELLTTRLDTKVNGFPAMPLSILVDKDEVRVGRDVFYVAFDWKAIPFNGKEQLPCARCKGKLSQGEMSVQCRCGAWFHQSPTTPCWTYDARCSLCEQPTAADPSTPEPLSRKQQERPQ